MKKNIAIITTIIIGITLIVLSIIIMMSNKKIIDDNNKVENNKHNYNEEYRKKEEENAKEKITIVAENEINSKNEYILITIRDKENGEEYNITNKDIELFKILAADENETEDKIKEKAIEYKIYSKGAQKLGITLSQDRIDYVVELSSSEQILSYIPEKNKKARNSFKERIYNYLMDIEYEGALYSKILREISNNNLSISNTEIDNKMQRYINIVRALKEIDKLSEDKQLEYVREKSSLIGEIRTLYLKEIKNKYTIEYK